MTNKEAIKIIKEDALYNPEVARLSIKALKKGITMEPVFKNGKLRCPVCGHKISGEYIYCEGCGQRISFILPNIRIVDAGSTLDISDCIDLDSLIVYRLKDDGNIGGECYYSDNHTNPYRYTIIDNTLLLPVSGCTKKYIVKYNKFSEGDWETIPFNDRFELIFPDFLR